METAGHIASRKASSSSYFDRIRYEACVRIEPFMLREGLVRSIRKSDTVVALESSLRSLGPKAQRTSNSYIGRIGSICLLHTLAACLILMYGLNISYSIIKLESNVLDNSITQVQNILIFHLIL